MGGQRPHKSSAITTSLVPADSAHGEAEPRGEQRYQQEAATVGEQAGEQPDRSGSPIHGTKPWAAIAIERARAVVVEEMRAAVRAQHGARVRMMPPAIARGKHSLL